MHVPVLLQETLDYLNVEKGKKFVDGTVGSGGHLLAILSANLQAQVLGIDLDQSSLDNLQKEITQKGLNLPAMSRNKLLSKAWQAGQRCILIQGNYKDIEKIISQTKFGRPDGIILDLGFSSSQLDDSKRGLSFQTDGPLDMRYDLHARLTAQEVVGSYHQKQLEQVIWDFGEEKFARRIAQAIIVARKLQEIKNTLQLAEIIRRAIPLPVRFRAHDNIRRVFQAIRIEVNHELDNLKQFLPKALGLLKPGGRLVVISFHSLEDRIVKEFFIQEAKDCVCPPEFPTCICDKASSIRILTRKPITASPEEISSNPRSKPAKLRAAEKLDRKQITDNR